MSETTLALSLATALGGMLCVLLWAIWGRLGRIITLLEALTLERWRAESLGALTRIVATARPPAVGEDDA